MRNFTLAILITLSGTAIAQSSSLKPGLWELKPIRQVVDGRDIIAQMASAQVEMQQAMANMPPDQRKQMEAMMKGMPTQKSVAGSGSRICVSPAMAGRDKPMMGPEDRCEPTKVNRTGNKSSFELNCTANGRTTVGKGESIVSGNTVTTRVVMTTIDARGSHTMESESQMTYLGPDCQGIKPIDQLSKGAQGLTR